MAAIAVLAFQFSASRESVTQESGNTDQNSPQPNGNRPLGEESALVTDLAEDPSVRTIAIEASSYKYEPDVIVVKKGETVRIEMNSADMMHNFVIDELGVSLPITNAGETSVVEFTADTVGEYTFYCSVNTHRQLGQEGRLIVEE